MSAVSEEIFDRSAELGASFIQPFPASSKIYVTGSRPDLRVPMREIEQQPTPAGLGSESNPPITVYDTSGPYTDPQARIDLRRGLRGVRSPWIEERGDTEQLPGPSSAYGRARQGDAALAGLRFEHLRRPRRARVGANVSQMHYARRGWITPEMEFVAIRESQRLEALRDSVRHVSSSTSPMAEISRTRFGSPVSSSTWLLVNSSCSTRLLTRIAFNSRNDPEPMSSTVSDVRITRSSIDSAGIAATSAIGKSRQHPSTVRRRVALTEPRGARFSSACAIDGCVNAPAAVKSAAK